MTAARTSATLSLELHTADLWAGLSEPSAARMAVGYRSWHGVGGSQEVCFGRLDQSVLNLEVPPPAEAAWTLLPAELGGPYHYGVGYLYCYTEPTDDEDGGVCWVEQEHRVLWLPAPFPVDRFGTWLAGRSPNGLDDKRLLWLSWLAAIPTGVSLARVARRSRSLLGFERAKPAPLVLDPQRSLDWPPTLY
jgi:hypothetical protein